MLHLIRKDYIFSVYKYCLIIFDRKTSFFYTFIFYDFLFFCLPHFSCVYVYGLEYFFIYSFLLVIFSLSFIWQNNGCYYTCSLLLFVHFSYCIWFWYDTILSCFVSLYSGSMGLIYFVAIYTASGHNRVQYFHIFVYKL